MNEERIKWLDLAKGLAILLVVSAHILEETDVVLIREGFLYLWYYPVHVPAFFLISGYLFRQSLCKHTQKDVFLKKLSNFLAIIPWTIICVVFQIVIYGIKNGDVVNSFVGYLVTALGWFWYLIALFGSFVFIMVVEKIRVHKAVVTTMLFIVMIMLGIYSMFLSKMMASLLIVYIGYSMTSFNKKYLVGNLFFYAGVLIYISCIYQLEIREFMKPGIWFVMMQILKISGCFVIPAISYLLSNIKKIKFSFVTLCGKNSLIIYIAQVFPDRIYEFLHNSNLTVMILAIFLTVAFCLILDWLIRKNKVLKKLLLTN